MLTGGSEFNEVFFDGARIPAGNVVGPVHGGWAVAMSLARSRTRRGGCAQPDHVPARVRPSRRAGARVRPHRRAPHPRATRVVLRARRDHAAARAAHPHAVPPRRRPRARRRRSPSSTGASTTRSPRTWRWRSWVQPGLVPEGHVPPRAYRTDDPGAPNSTASWEHVWMLNAASGTVYAGTSQVQRNILAESILGLPRESSAT